MLDHFMSFESFSNLQVGSERIITLGRSNDVLFVFTDDLKPIEELYYKNDAKETCNFAILYKKYYYISCQSAILQLSEVSSFNFYSKYNAICYNFVKGKGILCLFFNNL